jgi:putative ABC transport system permease protein
LIIGVPVGLGIGIQAVQVLGLFFSLPPPVLTIPAGGLIAVALVMVIASVAALGAALAAISRVRVASVLREL